MTGEIKSVLANKGYGFILHPDGMADIFFHKSGLQGISIFELKEGDMLQFDIEEGVKGPCARNIKLVGTN